MSISSAPRGANRLLALMSDQDFALLSPYLERVDLPKAIELAAVDQPVAHLVFPESGIASIIATSPEGQECEAGLFGRDGVGPLSPLLGIEHAAQRMIMQVPGEGRRISRRHLATAQASSPSLNRLVLQFVHVMSLQTSSTALSNAVHPIDERLARWLLMCHDRCPSDDIALTHEFMSLMLAVRRPSVTTSLHVLEGNGLIKNERGWVTIRNRKGLEDFAQDAYGNAEAEYRRLIGPMN